MKSLNTIFSQGDDPYRNLVWGIALQAFNDYVIDIKRIERLKVKEQNQKLTASEISSLIEARSDMRMTKKFLELVMPNYKEVFLRRAREIAEQDLKNVVHKPHARREELTKKVLAYIMLNPNATRGQTAKATGTSKSTVQRVYQEHKELINKNQHI